MHSLAQFISAKGKWFLFVLLLLVYLPILLPFGFGDDYNFIWNSKVEKNFVNQFLVLGRPVQALFNYLFYKSFTFVWQLVFLRLIGLTFFLWFANMLYNELKQYLPAEKAFAFTFLLGTALSFSVLNLWAATFYAPISLLFSLAAGKRIQKIISSGSSIATLNVGIKLLLPIALGILSLMMYQPTYTAILIPLFLFVYHSKFENISVKNVVVIIGIHFIIYIIYFVLFKLSVFALSVEAERAEFASDIYAKLHFFLTSASPKIFDLHFIFVSTTWKFVIRGISVLLFAIGLFPLVKGRKLKEIFLYSLFISSMIILLYLPNLLARENWASYRTLAPLTFFVYFIAYSGFVNIPLLKVIKKYIYIILLVVFGTSSICNNYMFARVQGQEFNEIKLQATALLSQSADSVIFQPIPYYHYQSTGIFPQYIADEFVVPSSAFEWSEDEILKQAIFEAGYGTIEDVEKITIIIDKDNKEQLNNVPIINPRVFTQKTN